MRGTLPTLAVPKIGAGVRGTLPTLAVSRSGTRDQRKRFCTQHSTVAIHVGDSDASQPQQSALLAVPGVSGAPTVQLATPTPPAGAEDEHDAAPARNDACRLDVRVLCQP